MIATSTDYQSAREELRALEAHLHDLEQSDPGFSRGLTKAAIRKMIARLHEQLAVYEGSEEVRQAGEK
jgi:hypothetical protein